MTTLKIFHATALSLLGLYGVLAARSLQGEARFYWMFCCVYTLLWCGLMWDNVWCARLLVLPPLLVVLLTVPPVILNLYAFVSGNPVYLDSPATILVVAVVAFFVTAPSAFGLALYWKERQRLFGRLK
jgi:hypothetical protein